MAITDTPVFIGIIIMLFFGFLFLPIAAILLIVYGFWHFSKEQKNIEESPDWIMAKHMFNIQGFPVWIHKIVGIIMITYSIYWIIATLNHEENILTKLYPIFVIIVLSVIVIENVARKWIVDSNK